MPRVPFRGMDGDQPRPDVQAATTAAAATTDLTEHEVALVLRRAAELDLTFDAGGPSLDVATVEESAVEAGLSSESVRTALAELRLGVLQRSETAAAHPRRLLGRSTVTVRRTVPGPPARVREVLGAGLTRELFRVRRERGEQASWARRDDLGANVRRSVDKNVTKRLALHEVKRLEVGVTAEPGSEGRRVLVVLHADVSRICHGRGGFVITGGAMGTAMVAGSVLLGVVVAPVVLLTAPIGAGVAAAGYGAGLRWYRRRVEDIELALEVMLDGLEDAGLEGVG